MVFVAARVLELARREATGGGRAGAGCEDRVDRVDIEREVQRPPGCWKKPQNQR